MPDPQGSTPDRPSMAIASRTAPRAVLLADILPKFLQPNSARFNQALEVVFHLIGKKKITGYVTQSQADQFVKEYGEMRPCEGWKPAEQLIERYLGVLLIDESLLTAKMSDFGDYPDSVAELIAVAHRYHLPLLAFRPEHYPGQDVWSVDELLTSSTALDREHLEECFYNDETKEQQELPFPGDQPPSAPPAASPSPSGGGSPNSSAGGSSSGGGNKSGTGTPQRLPNIPVSGASSNVTEPRSSSSSIQNHLNISTKNHENTSVDTNNLRPVTTGTWADVKTAKSSEPPDESPPSQENESGTKSIRLTPTPGSPPQATILVAQAEPDRDVPQVGQTEEVLEAQNPSENQGRRSQSIKFPPDGDDDPPPLGGERRSPDSSPGGSGGSGNSSDGGASGGTTNSGTTDNRNPGRGDSGSSRPTASQMVSGANGNQVFMVEANDPPLTIADFAGVGRGNNPSQEIIAAIDIIRFRGAELTAENMLLTQEGNDLVISFEEGAIAKVILTNFSLENLDNLNQASGSSIAFGNILFDGDNSIQDRFDVFNSEWNFNQVLSPNSVTFLNDLDNRILGLDYAKNVINGQGGDDIIITFSGDDILRGGAGNDFLDGAAGTNTLWGGSGSDTFVLSSYGLNHVNDFTLGQDRIGLANGLTPDQLTIEQGTGINSSSTWIKFTANDTILMSLRGVQANTLTTDVFVSIPGNSSPPLRG